MSVQYFFDAFALGEYKKHLRQKQKKRRRRKNEKGASQS
jgi:hypothetical protein